MSKVSRANYDEVLETSDIDILGSKSLSERYAKSRRYSITEINSAHLPDYWGLRIVIGGCNNADINLGTKRSPKGIRRNMWLCERQMPSFIPAHLSALRVHLWTCLAVFFKSIRELAFSRTICGSPTYTRWY